MVNHVETGTEPAAELSRRAFFRRAGLASAALNLAARASGATGNAKANRYPVIAFSKPFQNLNASATAELVAAVGWDGIEIPVRAKGHIEPERAADVLPQFAAALRAVQRDIAIVTTDITSLKTPQAETILRTMAGLKVKRLRLGFFTYRPDESPAARLREIAPALKDIADACRELGLQAGFQNHSGRQYVGAPIWDVYSMIRDLDPQHIGFCFDIGHATLEGGLSWPTSARLAEPFLTAVFVKDFFWKKEEGRWKDTWCPLGEGMVQRSFFDWLKTTGYRGPICQHHEYDLGDRDQRLAHFQQDLRVLKQWLA